MKWIAKIFVNDHWFYYREESPDYKFSCTLEKSESKVFETPDFEEKDFERLERDKIDWEKFEWEKVVNEVENNLSDLYNNTVPDW